jgi:peroxiredoxin
MVNWIRAVALLAAGPLLINCASGGTEPQSADSVSGAGDDSSSEGGLVGQPAPDFKLSSPDETEHISLQDLRGKVVVIDFWATWCDPCKESFPSYQRLSEEFGDALVVVGVSVDEEPDGIEDFRKATGVSFPLLWDAGGGVAEKYSPPKMPTSFVVDQAGVVQHVHAGYHDGEEDELRREVGALIED